MLSPATHVRFLAFMSVNFTRLALFYRVGSILFSASLFMSRSLIQVTSVTISAARYITILCVLSLFSLDVVRPLLKHHEFWFISIINACRAILINYLLGEIRERSFTSWLAFQSIMMIDANFCTFPSTRKSVVFVIPAVVGLLALFVLDRVRDMNNVVFQVKRLCVDGPNVLMLLPTNIVIFMAKKISRKITQIHLTFAGLQSIPCVVLKVRLCLTQALVLHRARSKHMSSDVITDVDNALKVRPLILSFIPLSSVDPRCILQQRAKLNIETDSKGPISRSH